MQLYNTKAIVLKTIPYGDTSLIVQAYTDLFGIQSYMVKSARKHSKKGSSKANYFQPAALLQLIAYHKNDANLQFIKEVNWSNIYTSLYDNVLQHTVAIYMIELVHHSIKQSEPSEILFEYISSSLQELDSCKPNEIANFPINFTIGLARALGFGFSGKFDAMDCPYLDIKEGIFVDKTPNHAYFLARDEAALVYYILNNNEATISLLNINRAIRKNILLQLEYFYKLHIIEFGSLKSLGILFELFD